MSRTAGFGKPVRSAGCCLGYLDDRYPVSCGAEPGRVRSAPYMIPHEQIKPIQIHGPRGATSDNNSNGLFFTCSRTPSSSRTLSMRQMSGQVILGMTGPSQGRMPWPNSSGSTTELKTASMALKTSDDLDVLAMSISHRPVVGLGPFRKFLQDLHLLGRIFQRIGTEATCQLIISTCIENPGASPHLATVGTR